MEVATSGAAAHIRARMRIHAVVIAFAACGSALEAQTPHRLRGVVVDERGAPIAYVKVTAIPGTQGSSDDAGRFTVIARTVPIRVAVRRIGFQPLDSTIVVPTADSVLRFVLKSLPISLKEMNVVASQVEGLARTGFYDRFRDRERGANSGWFITPEDIEARRPLRASHLLGGMVPGMRLQNVPGVGPHPVSTDGCVMDIYLDGMRMTMDRGGVDVLINVTSIAGVEVYTRASSVPARFQALNSICGVVAIWTRS
jgi:hypothetical protein